MNQTEDKGALQSRFVDWLKGADTGVFGCTLGSYHYTVIHLTKNENFDYLYCQRNYKGDGIELGKNFEYAGIFCRKNDLLYDNQYDIRDLVGECERHKEQLHAQLKRDVRQAVETAIGNDRRNLSVTEIEGERTRENLDYYIKHEAHRKAREAYLKGTYGDGGYTFTLRCHYDPKQWTEDSLLAYILDPAEYAAAEAKAYMDSHQEDMLSSFLQGDAVAAEYAAILDPSNPVHVVKRIMDALNASSAKNVYVTICKDGAEMTFKAEADQFRRDCIGTYSDWNIAAADRAAFRKRFAGNSGYKPEDIARIEYNRKVIYRKGGAVA